MFKLYFYYNKIKGKKTVLHQRESGSFCCHLPSFSIAEGRIYGNINKTIAKINTKVCMIMLYIT